MRKTLRISGIAVVSLGVLGSVFAILGRPVLNVSVQAFPITGRPGRYLYSPTLANWSPLPISLDAIKMGGGFAGGGTFYPCSLSVRDKKTGVWSTVSGGTLEEQGATKSDRRITVYPLQRKDVCADVLPFDGEDPIDCVRIAVHSHWQTGVDQKDEIASRIVEVPDTGGGDSPPCLK